ncbi:MAG: hypothetical protein ACTSRU_07365, partial [Candidatus Hodarchaeales archaeon]
MTCIIKKTANESIFLPFHQYYIGVITLQGTISVSDVFDYGTVVEKFSTFLRTSNKFKNVTKEFNDDKSLVIGIPESHGGPQLIFALNHYKGSFLLRIKGICGHFLKDYVTFIESLGVTAVKIQILDLDGEESYYQSSWKKDRRNLIPRFLKQAEEEGWLYGEFIVNVYFLRARKKESATTSTKDKTVKSP